MIYLFFNVSAVTLKLFIDNIVMVKNVRFLKTINIPNSLLITDPKHPQSLFSPIIEP